jgi:alcohol dehydrogenase
MLKSVEMRLPHTLIGLGAINDLGTVLKELGSSKVLIITDPGIVKAGIIDLVKSVLNKTSFKYDVYDKCEPNPEISSIEKLGAKVRSGKYDLIIGIGGGSVLDSTKLASLLGASSKLTIYDLLKNKRIDKVINKILIPTTAGTGSEWSEVAMVADERSGGQKRGIGLVKNIPNAVIIDPELTRNLPQRVTADTGMDAMVHAMEGYTSAKSNIVSDMFALKALELISSNIGLACSKGSENIEARYNMLIAAAMAMYACALSGVGIAHFMGHPLEKRVHVSHGTSCALMLPYTMRHHLIACPEKFAVMAEVLGEATDGLSVAEAATKSITAFQRISEAVGIPQTLTEIGIKKSQIPEMAEETLSYYSQEIKMWNPRDVTREDLIKIYNWAL